MSKEAYEGLKMRVERPARYAGGELHSAQRDRSARHSMALVFPDTYEIGMSHVGMRILYHRVNDEPDMLCERAFHPWTDMEATLRFHDEVLRTLESASPLKDFPLIGFSLPYEMLYGNVLNVFDLARIPFMAAERKEGDPIIIVGGPCTYNIEPMAPYIDLAVIGEAEAVIVDLCRLANDESKSREERLTTMAALPGLYRPSDLTVDYDDDGHVTTLSLAKRELGAVIEKVWAADLDESYFPCRPIVPSTEIVHDRANLEVHRGCIHGCRFCQAGYVYRPLRIRTKERLATMARDIVTSTGYEELGLVSLNTVDHPDIVELMTTLGADLNPKRIALGMPSMRMDAISFELARTLGATKKTNVTLAPEAGSQRLRDRINKGLTEEQILHSVDAFSAAGWRELKLYFMIGLPGETDEDVEAIVSLVHAILHRGQHPQLENDEDSQPEGDDDSRSSKTKTEARRSSKGEKSGMGEQPRKGRKGPKKRPFKVTVNVSSFVAKSHTPFQWEPMVTGEVLQKRMQILLHGLSRNRKVSLKWRDFDMGAIEGLLARGDRRLAPVIRRVWEDGGVLESWSDRFDYDRWDRALTAEGLSLADYIYRERPVDEPLPWDFISCGVNRQFLAKEWQRSRECTVTTDCVDGGCTGCGFGADCPTRSIAAKHKKRLSTKNTEKGAE